MKTVLWIVAAFVVVGIMSGGLVRNPDGTVDVSATVDQGATKGGELAGEVVDNVGNSIGHSIGSAVDSSDLAKVGVAAAAAAGVAKYGPKVTGTRIDPKPVTVPALTPTTQPPKRRTGWCKDVVTGAVQPCEPVKSTVPSTSTTMRSSPMSPGFTVPVLPTPPTWKPCVATPGILVNC